ncbi:MAG TPA: hypothetical protein VEP29_10055, partial [Desulfatiglandales bacterium]|nr:hypothetical protein [Desulfatiglandales bacterium]
MLLTQHSITPLLQHSILGFALLHALFRAFQFSCFRDDGLPQAKRSSNAVLLKAFRPLLSLT